MCRLMRRANSLIHTSEIKNFDQFTFQYFFIGEDIDHANVSFSTGPRATYMVFADNLVPKGTALVTPDLGDF